jgi:transposase
LPLIFTNASSKCQRHCGYIPANSGGYGYSRFCELYRAFKKTLSVTMRRTHAAGERLFVDYAGAGVAVVINRLTGKIRMAQIFVAVLRASTFTFAKATWTHALPDWRRRTFTSLANVDAALAELIGQLNDSLRRLGVTRRELLEEIDRPALKDLPGEPYEYSEWRVRRVGVYYHVDIDAHYYSVPYRFARAEVDAPNRPRVEIFYKGERIAVHLRASGNRKYTTVSEHMPSSHRRYAGWTIERIPEDARKIGPATAALCEQILESLPKPEQGYRACLGILRLASSYGAPRVEAAAKRAIEIGARTYGSVKSIRDTKLDRRPAP